MSLERKADLYVNVFAHAGYVGIQVETEDDGQLITHLPEAILNDPEQPGQLGCVCELSKVRFTPEAIELLKKVEVSGDDLGTLNIYVGHEETPVFAFMGGVQCMVDPSNCDFGSNSDFSLFDQAGSTPDDFEVPEGFRQAAESYMAEDGEE